MFHFGIEVGSKFVIMTRIIVSSDQGESRNLFAFLNFQMKINLSILPMLLLSSMIVNILVLTKVKPTTITKNSILER